MPTPKSIGVVELSSIGVGYNVEDEMLKAATVDSPKTRYFVPKSARTAARMFGMMPERFADRMLLKMYKWGPWA